MRILLVTNARSGRGKARSICDRLTHALKVAGHEAEVFDFSAEASSKSLGQSAKEAEVVVAVGGDGTVQAVASHIVGTKTAIYHAPLGTENLFSREFGMDCSADRLVRALAEPRVATADTATCNGRAFVIMASVGFDAGVVHRLAAARTGAISHLSYVGPIVHEVLRGQWPRLDVTVDGEQIVTQRAGLVVVANCRHYAMRLNPAPMASMFDGKLDVVFLPASGCVSLALQALRTRVRRHLARGRSMHAQGKNIVVTSEGGDGAPLQADGEALHAAVGATATDVSGTQIEIDVVPESLRILLPSEVAIEAVSDRPAMASGVAR